MDDIFKAIDKKMSSEQNEKSLEILAGFSRYHMLTGHYINKKHLMKTLDINNLQYEDIMTGEKSVPIHVYNSVIDYIRILFFKAQLFEFGDKQINNANLNNNQRATLSSKIKILARNINTIDHKDLVFVSNLIKKLMESKKRN